MKMKATSTAILWAIAFVLLSACTRAQENDWQTLFNGKDLAGWQQLNGKHIWEVRNGMIVGTTVPGEPNGFLCTVKEYADFVLELEVSIDTLMNNSGIQFRSLSYPDYQNGRVHGYQMEVDPKPQQWSGAIYEEGGNRGWLYKGEDLSLPAKKAFKRDTKKGYQWNKYRIECIGATIRTWVNGVPAAHLIDDKFPKGYIGLQLHANQSGDPAGSHKVRFRNIRIQTGNLKIAPWGEAFVVNLLGDNLPAGEKGIGDGLLLIKQDQDAASIAVFRSGEKDPILTQIAKKNERPYLHPIVAPDGKGVVTEYSPAHHVHQTGIYWGLKLVNGRDYFMNRKSDYWRGVSATVMEEKGKKVKWQTVSEMLDESGNVIMVETQNWSMRDCGEKYILDLEWRGEAKVDVVMGKFYVGGLFVRMPWQKGSVGEIVNSAGQKNEEVEGQRAIWSDVGIIVPGRDDRAHIAIFDHPDNKAFPTPWRYDSQLGLGPSRQILGDWKIQKGESEIIRYRLIVYTGSLNSKVLTDSWKEFILEY